MRATRGRGPGRVKVKYLPHDGAEKCANTKGGCRNTASLRAEYKGKRVYSCVAFKCIRNASIMVRSLAKEDSHGDESKGAIT
jgi:hypothetical protein